MKKNLDIFQCSNSSYAQSLKSLLAEKEKGVYYYYKNKFIYY